jgi:hypothetical protein
MMLYSDHIFISTFLNKCGSSEWKSNPDKPERIATKHQGTNNKFLLLINLRVLVSWCLGGENIMLEKSLANMMGFE